MSITHTLMFFTGALLIGILVGILVRCHQEGYLLRTWKYVFFFFGVLGGSIAIAPFVVPFVYLIKRDYNIGRRIFMFLVLAVLSPILLITTVLQSSKLIDSLVWDNAVKVNAFFKVVKAKKESNLRVLAPVPHNEGKNEVRQTMITVLRSATSKVENVAHII